MLTEVVAQVAALLEDGATARVAAFEVQLYPHRIRITHLDGLVPRVGNPFERFRLLPGGSPKFGDLGALCHLVDEGLRFILAVVAGCVERRGR